MNEATRQEIGTLVQKIAHSYARKCWWAEEEDLNSEGWIAALEAERTRDPSRPMAPYVATAVRRAIANFLVRQSSPVSASWHERHALYGLQRAPLDTLEMPKPPAGTADARKRDALAATGAADDRGWADDLLDQQRWRVRVMARLLNVIGEENEEGLDILIGVQRRVGRRPRWLLESFDSVEEKIRNDPELKRIWEERNEDT
jgi:DNA-directed RNA polymerase specialized sigma24 family protein